MNPLSSNHKTPEDYVFVHTDSHREFMDLLLEKRKQLENCITSQTVTDGGISIDVNQSKKDKDDICMYLHFK